MLKLGHKVAVDLEEFVLHGKFDYLEIGISRDQVLQILPPPDATDQETIHKAKIWRYGEFELYFDKASGDLVKIFTDYVPSLDGGEILDISPWILGRRLELPRFLDTLNRRQVDYQVTHDSILEASIVKIRESGVELAFSVESDGENHGKRLLSALWKADSALASRPV